MLVTGDNEYALYQAAGVLYDRLYKNNVYKSVSQLAIDLAKAIAELKNKPCGWFSGHAGWHAIRLLENDNSKDCEALIYIGVDVMEYQLVNENYHYVHTPGPWQYHDTPLIAEEDQVA